jgi:hypothetical protein
MLNIFEEAEASLKIGESYGWNRVSPIEHISTLGYESEEDFLSYISKQKGNEWYASFGTGLYSMKIPHWSIVGEYTGTIVYYNGYVTTYPDPKHMPLYLQKPKKKFDYDHYDDDDHLYWDDDEHDSDDYDHDDYNDDYGWWR